MTAIVFLLGVVAVYATMLNGVYMVGPLSVYQWSFYATTVSALGWAIHSRTVENWTTGIVLFAAAVVSKFQWVTADPEYAAAMIDIGLASWFILFGKRPWEYACGGIFLLSVMTSTATEFGFITDVSRRPAMIIAWSHPDITAILGHCAAIVLGMASGDSGKRIRLALTRWRVGDSLAHRGWVGCVALAKNLAGPRR